MNIQTLGSVGHIIELDTYEWVMVKWWLAAQPWASC